MNMITRLQHIKCAECKFNTKTRFQCSVCGKISSKKHPTTPCECKDNNKCHKCNSYYRSLAYEKRICKCILNDYDRYGSTEILYSPHGCKHIFFFWEIKESIEKQMKSMYEPEQINPQLLHPLWCPVCQTPLTDTWYFAAQIQRAEEDIKKAINMNERKINKIKERKDPELYEGIERHLFKTIHYRCNTINIFHTSPGVEKEHKCSKCKTQYFFVSNSESSDDGYNTNSYTESFPKINEEEKPDKSNVQLDDKKEEISQLSMPQKGSEAKPPKCQNPLQKRILSSTSS